MQFELLFKLGAAGHFNTNNMSGKGKGGKGKAGGRGGKSTSSSAKAGLQFPVARVGRFLKKGGKC
jgi:hypothetical protein